MRTSTSVPSDSEKTRPTRKASKIAGEKVGSLLRKTKSHLQDEVADKNKRESDRRRRKRKESLSERTPERHSLKFLRTSDERIDSCAKRTEPVNDIKAFCGWTKELVVSIERANVSFLSGCDNRHSLDPTTDELGISFEKQELLQHLQLRPSEQLIKLDEPNPTEAEVPPCHPKTLPRCSPVAKADPAESAKSEAHLSPRISRSAKRSRRETLDRLKSPKCSESHQKTLNPVLSSDDQKPSSQNIEPASVNDAREEESHRKGRMSKKDPKRQDRRKPPKCSESQQKTLRRGSSSNDPKPFSRNIESASVNDAKEKGRMLKRESGNVKQIDSIESQLVEFSVQYNPAESSKDITDEGTCQPVIPLVENSTESMASTDVPKSDPSLDRKSKKIAVKEPTPRCPADESSHKPGKPKRDRRKHIWIMSVSYGTGRRCEQIFPIAAYTSANSVCSYRVFMMWVLRCGPLVFHAKDSFLFS